MSLYSIIYASGGIICVPMDTFPIYFLYCSSQTQKHTSISQLTYTRVPADTIVSEVQDHPGNGFYKYIIWENYVLELNHR